MFTRRISLFIGAIVSIVSLSGMSGCGANVEPENSPQAYQNYKNAKDRIAPGKADSEERGEYQPINTTEPEQYVDAKETIDEDDDLEEAM